MSSPSVLREVQTRRTRGMMMMMTRKKMRRMKETRPVKQNPTLSLVSSHYLFIDLVLTFLQLKRKMRRKKKSRFVTLKICFVWFRRK